MPILPSLQSFNRLSPIQQHLAFSLAQYSRAGNGDAFCESWDNTLLESTDDILDSVRELSDLSDKIFEALTLEMGNFIVKEEKPVENEEREDPGDNTRTLKGRSDSAVNINSVLELNDVDLETDSDTVVDSDTTTLKGSLEDKSVTVDSGKVEEAAQRQEFTQMHISNVDESAKRKKKRKDRNRARRLGTKSVDETKTESTNPEDETNQANNHPVTFRVEKNAQESHNDTLSFTVSTRTTVEGSSRQRDLESKDKCILFGHHQVDLQVQKVKFGSGIMLPLSSPRSVELDETYRSQLTGNSSETQDGVAEKCGTNTENNSVEPVNQKVRGFLKQWLSDFEVEKALIPHVDQSVTARFLQKRWSTVQDLNSP